MLYQLHPIEWIEPSPTVDDEDQWLEKTLSAAGIDSQDGDDGTVNDHNSYTDDYYSDSHNETQDLSDLSPSLAAAASVVASRRRPLSLRSNRVPLPRPASVELSQSLHSYLSTVFDVNWSVIQPNNIEDSFVTASPSSNSWSTSSSSLSTSGSPSPSRAQTHSSGRPSAPSFLSPEKWAAESSTELESDTMIVRRQQQNDLQEAASTSRQGSSFIDNNKNNNERRADINYKVDKSHQKQQRQQQHQGGSKSDPISFLHRHGNAINNSISNKMNKKNKSTNVSSPRAGPESQTPPPRPSTPPPSQKTIMTTTMKPKAPPRPERPASPSAMPYTLSYDPDPMLSQSPQPNFAVSTAIAISYEPTPIMAPQQHIHNHIHIHVHNYPPEATTATAASPQRPITPPPRSARYPKPPPPRPTTTTTTEIYSYSTDSSSQWTADPKAILAATAAVNANLPPAWQPITLDNLLPTTVNSYPPEKAPHGPLDSHIKDLGDEDEEQPYLATSPPTSTRYSRSPPPPPYTQSPDQSSFAAPLAPSLAPSAFSPYEQLASKSQVTAFTPVLTSRPQPTLTNAQSNHNLLEYQMYQERQKMFARDDHEKADSAKSSLDGLGFIRRLSRQSSKKKSTVASISAPLPSTLSYSSSSPSTNSLSVAVPLHTIGGGLERYHDDSHQLSSSMANHHANSRYSLQPAAKNAVSMLKDTLSSVKSGLSRSSSPTPSSPSIGPIGPPMAVNSSALLYETIKTSTLSSCADVEPQQQQQQQIYHYSVMPTPSSTISSMNV
ncbi:hypothetical protein FBU30_008874 [Linnemannia zychae]|nr:hypothetical protein FBU30_008874 [Linnemannia zychae]